ncbi:MAG: site-2 protease family protein [Planctomycetes bacterium]|nr:site-2 protease family protein [Planctomycetota bacterium]
MAFGSILLAAIGIGLLIFVHELGHFLAARMAGVHVEVFSLGFGPRLAGFVWRGTDFRLSAVPFGGFVMVAGQDPGDRRYPREQCLWSKSIGQRALFWSGGVVMNALFALVAFPIVFRVGVEFTAPVIGYVGVGGAAWEAELRAGDRITSINGKAMYSFENLSTELALVGNRAAVLVVRGEDGKDRTVTVVPHFDPNSGLYGLGIQSAVDQAPPQLLVDADSAAFAAGLRTGDVLEQCAGRPPHDLLTRSLPAEPALVRVRRGEATLEATVTPRASDRDSPARIGVTLLPRRIEGLRSAHPLVQRLGLRRGDVVLAVDDRPFTAGDLAAFGSGPDRTRWHVQRDSKTLVLESATDGAERASFADHVALGADSVGLLLLPWAGDPAASAGLQAGDRLVRIDEAEVEDWDGLRNAVERAEGRPLRLVVRRLRADAAAEALTDPAAGDTVTITVTPAKKALPDFGLNPQFSPLMQEVKAESFGEAIRLGFVCSLDLVKQLYMTMKRLFTGEVGAKNLGGIIRISQFSYQAAQRGASWFWFFLGLLSVNLAFVNLLPIPVLDGGYLLFLLIEKVKGSPVSTRVLGYSQVVGLVFVLLLVLFVTYNDILRLL